MRRVNIQHSTGWDNMTKRPRKFYSQTADNGFISEPLISSARRMQGCHLRTTISRVSSGAFKVSKLVVTHILYHIRTGIKCQYMAHLVARNSGEESIRTIFKNST
jgi:hypothetical protein